MIHIQTIFLTNYHYIGTWKWGINIFKSYTILSDFYKTSLSYKYKFYHVQEL